MHVTCCCVKQDAANPKHVTALLQLYAICCACDLLLFAAMCANKHFIAVLQYMDTNTVACACVMWPTCRYRCLPCHWLPTQFLSRQLWPKWLKTVFFPLNVRVIVTCFMQANFDNFDRTFTLSLLCYY